MTCRSCGRDNPVESRFCNSCGADLSKSAEGTPPASAIGEAEEILFVLRPTFFFVGLRYAFAVLLSVAAGLGYAYWTQRQPEAAPPAWVMLLAGVIFFLPALLGHIQRSREVYVLTNQKIEFSYGILSKIRRNIPLNKVQDVTVTRSLGERMLGIGDILIDSAAATGKIPLRNVADPERYADAILKQIQHRSS